MTKILIVDDEYSKAGMISDFLQSIEPNVEIDHVTTSRDARIKARQLQYDLLILDINLPANLGSQPDALGGMALFDIISLDQNSYIPLDIIFITEKEDAMEQYYIEANKRGVSICRFNNLNINWKTYLGGRFHLAANRSKKEKTSNPHADIAILTALGNPELDAVLELPYEWQQKRFQDDPSGYYFGKKNTPSRSFTIVAASTRRKGMPATSAMAMKMIERFRPKLIVMLGICAGIKYKVNIGDIIIANPLWDWGSGKLAQDQEGSQVFQASPHQASIDHHISQLAIEIGSSVTFAQKIHSGWSKEFPQGRINVHVGPLASGAQVLAADSAVNHIIAQNRDIIGIDMEAYALMNAAEYSRIPSPLGMVIKSVCDFADSEKENSWQDYASYTSASFFDQLIESDFFPI